MAAAAEYRPRNPEDSVLYEAVAGHLETFLARQQERVRNVPYFVERELHAFLDCGVLARGFVRVHCDSCGHDRVVAFSCKKRGFCPSCGGRRMADTAAHLVDRVFPQVPVRQWVLSLPYALRYRLAYDASMLSEVHGVFIRTIFGSLRRRAREVGIDKAQCGAVTFIQRFGSDLRLNVHFHALLVDGVYAPGLDGKPEFFGLRPPEDAEVAQIVATLADRIPALLQRRGLDPQESDPEESDRLVREEPWLAGLYAASVTGRIATGPNAGRRATTRGDRIDPESLDATASPRCASAAGFSLHGNVAVSAADRPRLERLIRYCARPPLATERLERLEDGRLLYRFKTPWRNGTAHVVMSPEELIVKLAALVPTPRANVVRYSGFFAPGSKWRPMIVPASPPRPEAILLSPAPSGCEAGCSAESPVSGGSPIGEAAQHPRNYPWAELLKRVFALDVLQCDRCGGSMRIVSAIHPPETSRKILECLGLPSRAPPIAPAAPGWALESEL